MVFYNWSTIGLQLVDLFFLGPRDTRRRPLDRRRRQTRRLDTRRLDRGQQDTRRDTCHTDTHEEDERFNVYRMVDRLCQFPFLIPLHFGAILFLRVRRVGVAQLQWGAIHNAHRMVFVCLFPNQTG